MQHSGSLCGRVNLYTAATDYREGQLEFSS
jgi:hypothetical protein